FRATYPIAASPRANRIEISDNSMDCGLTNFDDGDMGGYHTYDNAVAHLFSMKSQYGSLVEMLQLGMSHENRMIWGLKISDNASVDESAEEATVHFDALHHAREPMSLEAILYYMWWLLENYENDPEAAYLINNREMYFIPVVNPDGYVFNQLTDPQGGGFWRKNRRNNGGGCFGVDLNRNYGFGWGLNSGSSSDPCTDIYRGESAFSEPESQAVRDLLMQTQPSIAFSMHTFGDVFLSPFGYTDSLATYDIYAEFTSEFIPQTYRGYGTTAKMLGYTSSGTTRDYLHSEGTLAWTPEIGHSFWEDPSDICDRVQEFLPTMKYLSWVSGNYACFHDFSLNNSDVIWEGEQVGIKVRVKNRGLTQSAEDVVVQLISQHPALVPVNDQISYGTVAARSYAENTSEDFLFDVQGDLVPGEVLALSVIVQQDGAEAYRDVIYLRAGEANILQEDDAENGFDNWISSGEQLWDTTFMDAFSGNHSFADSRYGNYLPQGETMIYSLDPVDFSTAENPWIEYNAKWSLEGNDDLVFLQASITNGNTWFFLKEYRNNSHWVQERIDLGAYIGQSNVLFRLVLTADEFVHSDGFYFDDFKIVDYREPDMVPTSNLDNPSFKAIAFPNPGKLPLQLALTLPTAGEIQLTITDVTGKNRGQQKHQLGAGLNTLSMPNLEAGVYFIQVDGFEHQQVIKVLRH
ncbi:MAG: M14 family zinc carboxypeptidase, partial [Bacteroidota bacterium]